MSALARHLRDLIARDGPIPLARYMAEALGHPEHGYYATQTAFGRDGDFVTAPEINQMFGELIGLWCLDCWRRMGAPARLLLVELGPGRGTLMADALRACRLRPAFLDAANVHLVETSPRLRDLQARTLDDHRIHWHDAAADLPIGLPMLAIANEFFDALPVHQFQRVGENWHERLIDADREGFRFVLSPKRATEVTMPPASGQGAVLELAPARQAAMTVMAERIVREGGALLVIDYGHAQSALGDTVQAVKAHRYHAVLETPGEADLTAHVDFHALRSAAETEGARVHGPVTQAAFLTGLGIAERAARLADGQPAAVRSQVEAALARLTASEQMGRLFKVMAVSGGTIGVPAGFEEAA